MRNFTTDGEDVKPERSSAPDPDQEEGITERLRPTANTRTDIAESRGLLESLLGELGRSTEKEEPTCLLVK